MVSGGFDSLEMTGHVCSPSWQILVSDGQRRVPVFIQTCRTVRVKNNVVLRKNQVFRVQIIDLLSRHAPLGKKTIFSPKNHRFALEERSAGQKNTFLYKIIDLLSRHAQQT